MRDGKATATTTFREDTKIPTEIVVQSIPWIAPLYLRVITIGEVLSRSSGKWRFIYECKAIVSNDLSSDKLGKLNITDQH